MVQTESMAKLVMISWVKREESWQWAEIQSLLMQDLVIASFFLLFWLAALKEEEACLDDEAVVVAQASVSADSAFISSSLLEVFFLQIHKED